MKVVAIEAGEVSKGAVPRKGMKRGLSILDFVLRIMAGVATLASAVAKGTTQERLPFATQFVSSGLNLMISPHLFYMVLQESRIFVLANSNVCGYLVLSLILSIFHIVRTTVVKSRILLVVLDTAMMSLVTAAASAAAAIVYKAHKGNPNVNWFAISQQYNSFCERILGSLIGSFIAVAVFIIPIIISAVLISRH
ncbi:hypothetical protein L6164_020821 [Bauhinia variegata]|uniref:Uncharacterized protein n=1 Tax=Bauhinia variegata TaxID=167791 RepID=A0ACB9MWL0_BAUVA|nr:hypothetical protein L6164_020821 [Bauhinia variegata]